MAWGRTAAVRSVVVSLAYFGSARVVVVLFAVNLFVVVWFAAIWCALRWLAVVWFFAFWLAAIESTSL